MDGQMPEMDGFSATTAIREREGPQGRRLPIITLTANAMKGERERCLETGMDDYASKSIRSEQILGPIEKLTRKNTAMPLMDSAALMKQLGNDSRRVIRPRYTWGPAGDGATVGNAAYGLPDTIINLGATATLARPKSCKIKPVRAT